MVVVCVVVLWCGVMVVLWWCGGVMVVVWWCGGVVVLVVVQQTSAGLQQTV